jgi:hypothetical protein
MTIVTQHACTILNFTAPNGFAKNILTVDSGKKVNTNRKTIIQHDFASFISLSLSFFVFIVDSLLSPAVASGMFCKGDLFLAARKILI